MSQLIRDMTEITRCGAQYRLDHLSPMGLKGCHASYLTEICAQPGISQEQLARRICINKSNVARQVAVLEEEGFVLRRPAPADKRVLEVYPTEKALTLLPQIENILFLWEECIAGDLTAQEQAILEKLLSRMKEKAVKYMEGR